MSKRDKSSNNEDAVSNEWRAFVAMILKEEGEAVSGSK